jgi:hypothetical protein
MWCGIKGKISRDQLIIVGHDILFNELYKVENIFFLPQKDNNQLIIDGHA